MPAPNHDLIKEKNSNRRLLTIYDELLRRFDCPALLVSESREIIHVLGGAGRFLTVHDGRPTADLMHAIHPDLRGPARWR